MTSNVEATPLAMCPFCREPALLPKTSACPNCGALLPWAEVEKELRAEMKARETSRLRATATLVHELVGAVTGGPKPSVDAVKGFVNAWMLPRAVLVAGSILGAIAVGVQIWVMAQQTDVMRQQTELMRQQTSLTERQANLTEQQTVLMQQQTSLLSRQTTSSEAQLAEIYRVRIAKLGAIGHALVPLYAHLQHGIEPVCHPNTCPNVQMTEFALGSADVYLKFSGRRPREPSDGPREPCMEDIRQSNVAAARCQMSKVLWLINQRVVPLTERASELGSLVDPQPNLSAASSPALTTASAVGPIESAATMCSLPQEEKDALVDTFLSLHLLSASAGAAQSKPVLQAAIARLGPRPHEQDRFAYPLGEFVSRAVSLAADGGKKLESLMEACKKKAARDQRALAAIERTPN